MPVASFTVTCTSKKEIAPMVYDLRFTKPDALTFKPGQFLIFDVPLVDDPADVQARSYSIASSPDEPELLFVVKSSPGGRFTRWMEELLTIGTQATIKGPMGFFTLDTSSDRPSLFICTGTGVAPFRSQLRHALMIAHDPRSMHMVFGVREKEDMFWTEEFMMMMKQFPNFRFHTSLTSGEPDWDGHQGRVQEIVPALGLDLKNVNLYICGAPEMVKEIKTLALGSWGMEKKWMHAEGYM